MAQRELNFGELQKAIDNIKQLVEQQRGHAFKYEIWYKNPFVSQTEMCGGAGSSNQAKGIDIVEQFNRDFDAILGMDGVVYIRIIMKNKGRVIAEPEIVFKPEYAPARTTPAPQAAPAAENPKIVDLDPNKPLKNSALGINAALELMGFGGLAGTDDGTGGLSAVLDIRDKIRDDQREKKEMQDKIEALIAEKTNLQRDLDEAKRQIEEQKKKEEAATGQLDGVNDELESLREQLEEAQAETAKSKSIGGLVGAALLSMAKAKAPQLSAKIPMLSGVFDALAADDEPGEPQQVKAAENEPRADKYNDFMAYARTLDDADFGKLWKVIYACARNKTAIDAMLSAAIPKGNEVEPEDNEE